MKGQKLIRDYLRQENYRDGLTALQLSVLCGVSASVVAATLKKMPDAYIDRWTKNHAWGPGRYAAVWCVVIPPPHCPPPELGEYYAAQKARRSA